MDNFGRSTETTYGCRRVKKECIDTIIGKSYVGDWFLFYLLGQNIDSVIFKVSEQLWRPKAIFSFFNKRLSRSHSEVKCQLSVINENLSNMRMNRPLLSGATPLSANFICV